MTGNWTGSLRSDANPYGISSPQQPSGGGVRVTRHQVVRTAGSRGGSPAPSEPESASGSMKKLSRRLSTDLEELITRFASPSGSAQLQRPSTAYSSRGSTPSKDPFSRGATPQRPALVVPQAALDPAPAAEAPAPAAAVRRETPASSRRSLFDDNYAVTPAAEQRSVWDRLHRNMPRTDMKSAGKNVVWRKSAAKKKGTPAASTAKKKTVKTFTEDWEKKKESAAQKRAKLEEQVKEKVEARKQGKKYYPEGETPAARLLTLMADSPGGSTVEISPLKQPSKAPELSSTDARAIVYYMQLMEHRVHHRIGSVEKEVSLMKGVLQDNFQELKRVLRMLGSLLKGMSTHNHAFRG